MGFTLTSCQKNEQLDTTPTIQKAARKESWVEFKIHGNGFWTYDGAHDELRCFDDVKICFETIVHAQRPQERKLVSGVITGDGTATGDLEIHINPEDGETMTLNMFNGNEIISHEIHDFYQIKGNGYNTIKYN